MTVPVDFFDLPSSLPSQQQKGGEGFFDLPSSENTWVKQPKPSITEQLRTAGPIFSQELLSGLWALPGMTADTWKAIGGYLAERGEKQAAKEGREISDQERSLTQKAVNFPSDVHQFLNKHLPNIFPTYQQAKKKVGEKIKAGGGELPEEPRGSLERFASGAGKAGQVLAFPGSALVKGAALGTSGVTEALDLSEGKKIFGNLTVPALTSIIQSVVQRKYRPSAGEGKFLYDAGKRLGMSDSDLAPILATEGQVQRYGQLASAVPKTRKSFENTGQVLGNVIEDMQNRPQNFTQLPANVESRLIQRLSSIERDIRIRSHSLSPKEKEYADFIRTTIDDIVNNGSTPRQLIGTVRSANKVGSGKTELRRIMDPIKDAIKSVDPQLAADLEATNAMYAKYISNLREINPTQFNAFVDAGDLQQLLGAVFSGNPSTLGKQILNMASAGTLRRISSHILTDPAAQSLVRNFGQAVRDGRAPSARALGIQLQQYVQKNMPQEYEEIDWDKLGISPSKSTPETTGKQ